MNLLSEKLPKIVVFLTTHMKNRADKKAKWASIKREHNTELCELLSVDPSWDIQAGNLLAFDIDEERKLVLLNYSSTAHNLLHEIDGGWSPELRLMRGLVYKYEAAGHLEGVKLASRGFEKFFNRNELPETSVENLSSDAADQLLLCTRKEDGHMIEYFMHDDKLCSTTRGRLDSLSGNAALSMLSRGSFIKASCAGKLAGFDLMTLVCEFVHPDTEVHVDYAGAKKIFLLEAYDKEGNAATRDVLQRIRLSTDGVLSAVDVRWMTFSRLLDEINDRSVENCEGWVAQIPTTDGGLRRVKFKYIDYIGRMVSSKLSYKYLMNCMKNDRLDMMLITLPEEIRKTAYDMVSEVKTIRSKVSEPTGYRSLYELYNPAEGSVENFRNVCRSYYRAA